MQPKTEGAPTARVEGTRAKPAVKILPIYRVKISAKDGSVIIEGYANTKNHPDRYGDVPATYAPLRDYVYDVSEFLKNPVMLIDHVNAVDHVAGSMVDVHEDATGLFFQAVFSKSDYPVVAHARQVYEEGHARGISIAGRFHFENPQSPEQLTLAEIYEISLVAVPADPNALAEAMKKALAMANNENSAAPAKDGGLSRAFSEMKTTVDMMTLNQNLKALNRAFQK
ncbi:MAG: HK97 family phage prohead protease [Elusimicrobiales bacterium]|nr:HK97 family phage prohead protease [Elusimicrobiales bacterium]